MEALDLVPLGLQEIDMWDPKEHYWGEENDPAEPWTEPITRANDLKEADERAEAIKILMNLCDALQSAWSEFEVHPSILTYKESEALSHYTAEPLASKLERSHPDISARVYCALCMRVTNAGKSKYYDAALNNIERAKKCYAKAGLDADWQAVVDDIHQRHFRKKGFMAGFEAIVSGTPKHVEPPFLFSDSANCLSIAEPSILVRLGIYRP